MFMISYEIVKCGGEQKTFLKSVYNFEIVVCSETLACIIITGYNTLRLMNRFNLDPAD